MSTILITGGCGFVGSHLARFLLQHDYNVILMDSAVNEKLVRDIRARSVIVEADVTDKAQLTQVLRKHRVDGLVHYAAILSSAAESQPFLGYKVNFEGVWNVYNAARASEVESVIFASSTAAYGSEASQKPKENIYTVPQTLYGISKQFGEMLGFWFYRKYGIQFAAFRYGSIVGPGRRNGGASAYSTLIIQKPSQGQPYRVNVRKEDSIPVAYIKDAAEVTTLAYENIKRLKSRVYNVVSLSSSPTAGELASSVKKHIPKAAITFDPDPKTVAMVRSWPRNLDIRRVQTELRWRPRYSNLDTLITDFAAEVKEHPEMFHI